MGCSGWRPRPPLVRIFAKFRGGGIAPKIKISRPFSDGCLHRDYMFRRMPVNTDMKLRKVPVEKLKPAKYNPRKDLKPGDPVYEKIKRSMTT